MDQKCTKGSMAESKVSLKLLIDTKSKRVLFAEARKDFVDFIFHILAMPLATAISLLGKQGMVGCLSNLYDSVENLDDSYIQKGQNKDVLLKPNAANPMTSVPLLLLNDKPTANNFYSCNRNCSGYVTDEPTATCPNCRCLMNKSITNVAPPHVNEKSNEDGGFVKGVVTYMVTDDLKVKPVSTISSITMLSEFNIKDIGSLHEKEIKVGMNEALKLLKASLHSNKSFSHRRRQQQEPNFLRCSASSFSKKYHTNPPKSDDVVELPLFPLPLVLFPGAILHLQIFEFRYRMMMHTLLQTDLWFGVIYTNSASGTAEVGCMGEVIKHERLVDDRFFLICKGQKR
ncbi:uncharacterized protein Fot_30694 [Forsythia ovata]|uniref:Lon N-terminal domain-containing protein n=1 Tax=Forsythia ovata TaxID=205694 RepID=A0ABD1T302_9LAMI